MSVVVARVYNTHYTWDCVLLVRILVHGPCWLRAMLAPCHGLYYSQKRVCDQHEPVQCMCEHMRTVVCTAYHTVECGMCQKCIRMSSFACSNDALLPAGYQRAFDVPVSLCMCVHVCVHACMHAWVPVCLRVCMYVLTLYVWMPVSMTCESYMCMYNARHACNKKKKKKNPTDRQGPSSRLFHACRSRSQPLGYEYSPLALRTGLPLLILKDSCDSQGFSRRSFSIPETSFSVNIHRKLVPLSRQEEAVFALPSGTFLGHFDFLSLLFSAFCMLRRECS